MKLAVIFNGQGAHYEQMGMDFVEYFAQSAAVFDLAERISQMPIRDWIKSDLDQFKLTQHAQIGIAATSLAIYQAIQDQLPQVAYMAGLSLGEYTALIASQSIDMVAGFKLLVNRGAIMSKHCQYLAETDPAGMTAVMGSNQAQIEALIQQKDLAQDLFIANLNSKQQIIIGGRQSALSKFKEVAKAEGIKKLIPLKVEGPFHTPLMSAVGQPLKDQMESLEFKQGQCDVIANTTVLAHACQTVRDTLVKHLIEPVRWEETIAYLIDQGVSHILQIGPGNTLDQLLKRDGLELAHMVVDKVEDLDQLKLFLKEGI